jgi:hypothetical protein
MAPPLSREALQRQVKAELVPGTEVMDDSKSTLRASFLQVPHLTMHSRRHHHEAWFGKSSIGPSTVF